MADIGQQSMTLPTDSTERKNYPMVRGCLNYFPAALAGVSKISKLGNDKHNPGEPLHHARDKSTDHADCIMRHLVDTEDLLAANAPGEQVLIEVSQMAWRVLAYSQIIHEQFGAPMAPGATTPSVQPKTANDLFAAAEKAQVEIQKMVETNKNGVFSLERKTSFSPGDIVKHLNNDVEVTVQATYYDDKGNPILFVKDAENQVFGVDPKFYKGIYK